MRDIIPELRRWRLLGRRTSRWLPSLRPAARRCDRRARMAITAEGDVAGSVSSGCVDGDVIAEMEAVLKGSTGIRRPSYGISDEQAWGAGLSCGGAIDVLVERWSGLYDSLIDEVEAKRPVAFASRLDRTGGTVAHLLHRSDGQTLGTLGDLIWMDRC